MYSTIISSSGIWASMLWYNGKMSYLDGGTFGGGHGRSIPVTWDARDLGMDNPFRVRS